MTALTKSLGTVVLLVALGYVAFFAIANGDVIAVTIWPQIPAMSAPIWLVSLSSFCLGLAVIAIIANIRISALRLRLYRAQKKLEKQDKQLQENEIEQAELSSITHK